jgi:hypothetical protein
MDVAESGLYRHPSPFTTNIYWREEMALGPGPPQKRSGKEGKGSQRRLLSAGPGSSLDSRHRYRSGGRGMGGGGGGGDGASVSDAQPESRGGSGFHHDWWYKRHQREDEVLWGSEPARRDGSRGQRRRSIAEGSSVGVTGMGRADTGSTSPESYYVARNPPVNALHPPIVRTPPTNRNETRWMLQPPPKACVMNGKEQRVSRDRCDSGAARPIATNRASPPNAPSSRLKQELSREAVVAAAEARMSVLVDAERPRCKKRRRLNGPRLDQDFIPYVDSTEATADASGEQPGASSTSPPAPLQETSGNLGQTTKVDSSSSHAKKGLLEVAGQLLDRTTLEEEPQPKNLPSKVSASRGVADGKPLKPDAIQKTSGSPGTKTARTQDATATIRHSETSSRNRHAAPTKPAHSSLASTVPSPLPQKFATIDSRNRPDMSNFRSSPFNTTTTTTTTTLRLMLKNGGRRASDAQSTELMAYRWENGSTACARPSATAFKAMAAAAANPTTATTTTTSQKPSSPPCPLPAVMICNDARLPAPAAPSLAFSSSFHFAAASPAPPSDLAHSLSSSWLSPSPPSPTTVLASTPPVPVNLHMDTKMSMMRWSMDI